jgi:hypothetical protein
MRQIAQFRGAALQRHPLPTARSLADSLLADDAIFRRVAPEARSALVDAALSEGRACAESISLDRGTDPWAVAHGLGVAVVERDENVGFGTVVVFAEYAEKPPAITLYRPAIEWANQHLAASRAGNTLDLEDCGPVFLAHELYHHLASNARRPPFSRTYRVTLLRLGAWRWTSRVAGLEEIAAGAFAQALLGLEFYPRLIEWICARQDGGEQSWTTRADRC